MSEETIVASQETSEEMSSNVDGKIEVQFNDLDLPKTGYPEANVVNNKKGTLGLEDELPEEVMSELRKQCLENLVKNDAYNIDKNLDTDANGGKYKYCLVSFIGPTLTAKSEVYGFNIIGAFEDIDSLKEHIEDLTNEEKIYDIGIVEMYKFIPSFPVKEEETQEQQDKFLNDIIVKHKEERELSKLVYEYRKEKLMTNENRIIEKDLPTDVKKITEIESNVVTNDDVKPRNETHAKLLEKLKKKNTVEADKTKKTKLKNYSTKMLSQNYAALCFVGHSGTNKRTAMKIKGIFNSEEECRNFCKEANEINDTYDILTSEMYSWLPCDPEIDKIEQVHTSEGLNDLINASREEKKKTSKVHEEHKKINAANGGPEGITVIHDEESVKNLLSGFGSGPGSEDLGASSLLKDIENDSHPLTNN
jgi:hypothetical protein